MISISLHGHSLTTADLEWFRGAVEAAAGHSGNDYPIEITDGTISVTIPGEEEEATTDDAAAPLKVGDRVRVTAGRYEFGVGELTQIDQDDVELPFYVRLDGLSDSRWVKSIERVTD